MKKNRCQTLRWQHAAPRPVPPTARWTAMDGIPPSIVPRRMRHLLAGRGAHGEHGCIQAAAQARSHLSSIGSQLRLKPLPSSAPGTYYGPRPRPREGPHVGVVRRAGPGQQRGVRFALRAKRKAARALGADGAAAGLPSLGPRPTRCQPPRHFKAECSTAPGVTSLAATCTG